MTELGYLSISIGLVLGFINVGIINKYWDGGQGFEVQIIFLTVMVDLVLVPYIVFGIKWTLDAKAQKMPWVTGASALAVVVAVILITTVMGASLMKVSNSSNSYFYRISTHPADDQPYFMYLPLPLNGTGEVAKFIKHLKVEAGSGNFSVIQTIHGWALNLSSKGPIQVGVSGTWEEEPFNSLSLRNGTSELKKPETYWVYYHLPSNLSMHFDQWVRKGLAQGTGEVWEIDAKILPTNWTIVEGEHGRYTIS